MNTEFEKLEREIDRGISALDALRPEDERLFAEVAPQIRSAMLAENARMQGARGRRRWLPLFGAIAAAVAAFALLPQARTILFGGPTDTGSRSDAPIIAEIAPEEVEDVAAALSEASDSIASLFSAESLITAEDESTNLTELQDLYRSLSENGAGGA